MAAISPATFDNWYKLLKDNELWEDNNLVTQASEIYSNDEVRLTLEKECIEKH